MMYERTIHEIKYHHYATGPQGERFVLFPVGGRNTLDQINEAKAKLKREQDVVKIDHEWVEEKEWKTMKLFFHPMNTENDFLNEKYHELFNQIYI